MTCVRVLGAAVAGVVVTVGVAGCSNTPAAQRSPDADCGSGYRRVATAPSWPQLAHKLQTTTTIFGQAAGVRTVQSGDDLTGAGGHRVDRVVDLLNRRGHRLIQLEVWREGEHTWRASYFAACY